MTVTQSHNHLNTDRPKFGQFKSLVENIWPGFNKKLQAIF